MLDDLLPFLIAVFVVVNFVRGFLQNGSRRGSPRSKRGAPAAPQQSSRTGADTADTTPAAGRPMDELEKRLQEAARRVQQAQQGGSGQPNAAPVAATDDTRGVAPQTQAQPPATPVGPPPGFLGREGVPPAKPATAKTKRPPVRQRRETPPRRDPAVLAALNASADDLVRGIVWSEVLSGPKAAPHLRRSASIRRSR